MFQQIARYLPEFPSAVLSVLDAEGYPYSVRCRPSLDLDRQRLRVPVPAALPLQPGPACLLCHAHDERLWNLKSFVVQGTLARESGGWVLTPLRFIPGMGIGGWRSYLRLLRASRAATRQYFAQRGLTQPRVTWHEYMALFTSD